MVELLLFELLIFIVILIFFLAIIYICLATLSKRFRNKVFNNNSEKQYMKKEIIEANNSFNDAMKLSDTQKRKKNIIFPDEIKQAQKNGTSVNTKKIYISETPDVEFYNSRNNKTYKSSSYDAKKTINDSYYEELENDDPIKEYGIFNRIKKYFK